MAVAKVAAADVAEAAEVVIDIVMILIADSGATKTDWCVGADLKSVRTIRTGGINPFHQSESEISAVLSNELIPDLCVDPESVSFVYFYGAGCTPEKSVTVRNILLRVFRKAEVSVESDLTGAARALCGDKPGVACILGTGSNSGLYDGSAISCNVSPLGYILGDEGSGAYLGKRFVADCLKGILPESLRIGLLEYLEMTAPQVIDRIYRQPQANRFLASVSPYIYKCKENPAVRDFLMDCFTQFFRRNILQYPKVFGQSPLPAVSFVGSVAWYFQEEISCSASLLGLQTGRFLKEPLPELIKYHLRALS